MHGKHPWHLASLVAIALLLVSACGRTVSGPEPAVLELEPRVVCNAQLDHEIVLRGSGLSASPVDALTDDPLVALPQVSLIRAIDLDGAATSGEAVVLNEDTTSLDETRVRWVSQDELRLVVDPDLDLADGVFDIQVRNATGGETSLSRGLAAVPPPVVTSAEPAPICNAQSAREIRIGGTGFVRIDDALPTVEIGDRTYAATDAAGCSDVDVQGGGVALCTELTVVIPEGDLDAGAHPVVVTNPQAAGCASSEAVSLHVVPPPTVDTVAPNPVCLAEGNVSLTLTGSGLLEIDGAVPDVTVGGVALTGVSMVADACEPLSGVDGVRSCTSLVGLIAEEALDLGAHRVSVENPEPAGCISVDEVDLQVVPPPDVASISPTTVCSGGGSFTVTGTDLWGIEAELVDSQGGVVVAQNVSVNDDATAAQVSFGAGLRPETYTLQVTGAGGCGDSLDGVPIEVTPGPSILFVDPPVVFSGVAIRATLFVSAVTEAPDSVVLAPAGGGEEITLADVSWSIDRRTIVRATIPAGLDAGVYDVFMRGVGECDAFLSAGVTVVDEATLALADPPLAPEFGEAETDIAVTLFAVPEGERAAGETGFISTPRAYVSSADLAVAEPLRAVTFEDDTTVSAIIPGLPDGSYHLVIVNPDGTVGFAENAFRFTDIAPPVIEDVSPSQLENDTSDEVSIIGENLAPADDLEVRLECLAPTGAISTYDAVIEDASPNLLTVTVPTPSIGHGSVCVVRVSNTVNDTWDEWSAISVTNPAARLPEFRSGSELSFARRAPASAVGRATREARYVYAIGGDDGSPASAFGSVETALLGRFGGIGQWRTLQTELPEGRTLAAAHREGRFIYLVGGMVGGEPTGSILRAEVLDPAEGPQILDVEMRFYSDPDEDPETRDGLEPGGWTYMIAAIHDDSHLHNPFGETLPSEPITLYAPDVPDGVEVELVWSTVYGTDGDEPVPASAYYVYRTREVDGGRNEIRLLAIEPGTDATEHRFVDRNPDTFVDEDKQPLRLGGLGVWHPVGSLSTPRAAFGFAAATDPACRRYFYAIGGRTDAASESASYEYAFYDPTTETLGEFTEVTATVDFTARREHGVFVATGETATPLSECESRIYAAYGRSGAGTDVTNARIAAVTDLGVLGPWEEAMVAPAAESVSGFAAFFSSDGGYILGGRRAGSPSPATRLAALCEPAPGNPTDPCNTNPLMLSQWSDAANNLSQARHFPGFARRGAFFYLVGGAGTGGPLATTEVNVR
jgi:hypothetical protein